MVTIADILAASAECVASDLAKKSPTGESSQWLPNLNLIKVPGIRKHERFTPLVNFQPTKVMIHCNGS